MVSSLSGATPEILLEIQWLPPFRLAKSPDALMRAWFGPNQAAANEHESFEKNWE